MPLESPERSLRILLIDDDRIQMQLTQAMLQQIQPEKTAWEIVSCRTPEEVFRRIEQHRFDLLFTDIQMPSMNGFDVLKNIRSLNPHAHAQLPVVAITARNDMQEAFSGNMASPPAFTSRSTKKIWLKPSGKHSEMSGRK